MRPVPPDLSRVRLPPRTIPEELLTFKARTYFASDTGNPYPNVHGVHLAEFKVVLSVRMEDLGLDRTQQEKLRKLAGLRFNKKEQILRLPCELFPSRVENKKYLVYLLETLLEEARKPDAPEPAAPPLTEHPHEQDTIHIKF
ncbi:ribosomal protein S24/S35, mitochondrial, conserved domain-containing protein [Tribonema minus]|uniref:Ribosomal protein S24/S35, mitochondrial, conserved domain-containing protein n=1 Tax=Tribonema minus TaxID=303371 RepID=A0A836CGV1_9STRA|nr:ribosomal protein S24/S35, mitochondrial, conserved domain-containing protein [Tribonema minus]